MGCLSSKPKENSKSSKQEKYVEDDQKDFKKEMMDKIKELTLQGKHEDALENLLSVCDYDIGTNIKETDFVYERYIDVAQQYLKLNDPTRSQMYIVRVYYHQSWKNIQNPNQEFRNKISKCVLMMSEIFLKKDRPLVSRFFLEANSSFVANEQEVEDLMNKVKKELDRDEVDLVNKLRPDLDKIKDLIKKKKSESDEAIALQEQIGRQLAKDSKHGDACFFFIKCLDYYTAKNLKDTKYGASIGDIYLDIARSKLSMNKFIKAAFYAEKASLLSQKEENRNEAEEILKKSEQGLMSKDKQLNRPMKEEKQKYTDAIKSSKTENSDVYHAYLYYAAALIDQDRADQAICYLKRCYYYYSYKSFVDADAVQLAGESLTLLGRAYKLKKKYVKAQFHIERAIPLLKEPQKSEAAVDIIEINKAFAKDGKKPIMSTTVRNSILKAETSSGGSGKNNLDDAIKTAI